MVDACHSDEKTVRRSSSDNNTLAPRGSKLLIIRVLGVRRARRARLVAVAAAGASAVDLDTLALTRDAVAFAAAVRVAH